MLFTKLGGSLHGKRVQTPLRKGAFTAIVIVLFLGLLIACEMVIRTRTMTPEFARFFFFTEFKIDRWHYLSENMSIHQLDMVMASHPYIQYIEQPEANRPPFDQVPVEFHVQNNGFGFRDGEFNVDPRKKQIVVLGDSVVFGKGVTQEERFTSLLQKQLPNAQIFNLGLQGCTAECMAKLWDQYVNKLQPDMLIIQASGNDLDQVLYKESMEKRLPWTSNYKVLNSSKALGLHSGFYISEERIKSSYKWNLLSKRSLANSIRLLKRCINPQPKETSTL